MSGVRTRLKAMIVYVAPSCLSGHMYSQFKYLVDCASLKTMTRDLVVYYQCVTRTSVDIIVRVGALVLWLPAWRETSRSQKSGIEAFWSQSSQDQPAKNVAPHSFSSGVAPEPTTVTC